VPKAAGAELIDAVRASRTRATVFQPFVIHSVAPLYQDHLFE
jgi:hypothetical protein